MPSTKYSPVSPGTPPLVETDEESLVRPPPSTRTRTPELTHPSQPTKRQWFVFILATLILGTFFTVVGLVYARRTTSPSPRRRNLIMMISDGFGPASQTYARSYHAYLENLPYTTKLPLDDILVGSSRTRSSSSLVTDSAAGATAFACGIKTYNAAIGVDPDAKPCASVLEAAKMIGMKTGLVVTSRVTHATPASFSAHVLFREYESDIAVQQIGDYSVGRSVDLMFGGGYCHFMPNTTVGKVYTERGWVDKSCRTDDVDLLESARNMNWTVVLDRSEFSQLKGSAKLPLMYLAAPDHMAYNIDRNDAEEPSLAEMVTKSLEILTHATSDSDQGFFLVIEGSRIDMAAHSNDPATHLQEVLVYNQVVEIVTKYVDARSDTIMISTSDHETGGFSLGKSFFEGVPEYLWRPEKLVSLKNSTIRLAADMIEARKTKRGNEYRNYIESTILQGWLKLGVKDYTFADVVYLSNTSKKIDLLDWYLGTMLSSRANLGWSSHGHSGVDVNLYAHGPDSNELRGNRENTEIRDFIVKFLGLQNSLESVANLLKSLKMRPWKGVPDLLSVFVDHAY